MAVQNLSKTKKTNSQKLSLKNIFKPFTLRLKRFNPKKLIELFAHKTKTFSELYFEKLPKKYQLNKQAEELVKSLDFPVPEAEFSDFLRAMGAVCDTVFVGPKRILFDISYGCNLDCVYCRRHSPIAPSKSDRPRRSQNSFLPIEYLCSTLDDAKELLVEEILLVGGGEPTIHPQFHQLVKEVKKRGFTLSFSTNGMLLNRELVDTLVETGVDNLTISVTGVSFDTYKKTHPKTKTSDFEKLFRNFEYLNYKRRDTVLKTGVEFVKPFLIFLHVITSENYHEVYDMAFAGAEYGFDTIWYKLVHASDWSRHLCLNKE
jgi:sulfatase maturation enzyme AslB (radical SAM superfamily)